MEDTGYSTPLESIGAGLGTAAVLGLSIGFSKLPLPMTAVTAGSFVISGALASYLSGLATFDINYTHGLAGNEHHWSLPKSETPTLMRMHKSLYERNALSRLLCFCNSRQREDVNWCVSLIHQIKNWAHPALSLTAIVELVVLYFIRSVALKGLPGLWLPINLVWGMALIVCLSAVLGDLFITIQWHRLFSTHDQYTKKWDDDSSLYVTYVQLRNSQKYTSTKQLIDAFSKSTQRVELAFSLFMGVLPCLSIVISILMIVSTYFMKPTWAFVIAFGCLLSLATVSVHYALHFFGYYTGIYDQSLDIFNQQDLVSFIAHDELRIPKEDTTSEAVQKIAETVDNFLNSPL